jgi:hypothetical protein
MCADNMQRRALPLGRIVGSHEKVKASKVEKQKLGSTYWKFLTHGE